MTFILREPDGTPVWSALQKVPQFSRSEVCDIDATARKAGCTIVVRNAGRTVFDGEGFLAGAFPPCVYFIKAGEFVKIGRAKDPFVRMKELATGNPHTLEFLGGFAGGHRLEQDLHHYFADYRTRSEWFRYEGELRDFVEHHFNPRKPPKTGANVK